MNGAQALMKTLADAGIEVCFSNPGTSEMHFVAALDSEPRMRAMLALFEGVATGAADGYARMAGKPAATLLHLGCGLGNGLANLHNARRANTPIVNVIALNLAYLVVGVVVVEVVFVYPGLGQLLVDSVSKRDIPVVQACSLIFAATYILLNTGADVLSIATNPRLMHPKG